MFKIVETIEKRKKHLIIVPSNWEKMGTLFWPKTNAGKYIEDAQSKPEANWLKLKCKVKRNYLLNKEIAEEELNRMLDSEEMEQGKDTTSKRLMETSVTQRKRKRGTISLQNVYVDQTTDLNLLPEPCSLNELQLEVQPAKTQFLAEGNAQPESNNENITLPALPYADDNGELKENIAKILKNQENGELKENVEKILKNQEILIQRFAKLEVMFDEFTKVSSGKQSTRDCSSKKAENIVLHTEPFNLIDNIEDLQKLEEELKNKDTFAEYVEKMSFICGRNAKRNNRAMDNCYLLIDRFFTRHFMTMCSWAGGSRQNNVEKIPFKVYKNVINLFFQLIYLSDDTFTMQDCELFFKNIIRNSTRRNDTSKPTSRQSKSKNRPKKLVYKVKRTADNQLPNEEMEGIRIKEEEEYLAIQVEDENLTYDETSE